MFIRAFYTESQNKTKMVKELRKTLKKNKKEMKQKDAQIASLKARLGRHSEDNESSSSSSLSQTISDSIINQQAAQISELQAKLQKYELMILNQLEHEVEMEQEQNQHSLSMFTLSEELSVSNDHQVDHHIIHSEDIYNAESDGLDKVIESCQDTMCQILEGIATPFDVTHN